MKRLLCLLTAGLLAGCQSAALPPMTTVPQVDLERFILNSSVNSIREPTEE